MQTIHTRIEGRVQGVFFRESTRKEAVRLGLKGWVKNMNDGAVEAVFQGDEKSLTKMQAWLKEGPSQARVTEVVADHIDENRVYDTFQIVF